MEDPELMDVQIENSEGVNYLTDFGIIRLHATIMGCTVEEARDWLRSPAGLNSAIIRPRNAAYYEEDADIPLQAAYLAHGVAEGQLFIDGNKRTGLVAMETFLNANGYWLTATDDALVEWMLDLSKGLSVYGLAKRISDNSESL